MAKQVAFSLRLLGPVRLEPVSAVEVEGWPRMPRFRSRRTLALLGYLAVEQRPVARESLAALLWPEESSAKGRANLRRELYNLGRILRGCWELDSQTAAFHPTVDIQVDIYALLALERDQRWVEAAELLAGEFLEGLYLENNAAFESWLLAERERWRQRAEKILTRVVAGRVQRGRYAEALTWTRRLLHLAPWNEWAHRQAMRLLAWTGRRGAALRQFESCKEALWEELSAEPAEETLRLHERIRAGELNAPPPLPAFLGDEDSRHGPDHTPFVARQDELDWLDGHLQAALSGEVRLAFVTGSPGRGKTALMHAFARQAMAEHARLLVATGHCNGYASVGDPYLPFRDVMAMLTGDVEARWDAGIISRRHATRLWLALPLVLRALLDHGPHLLDVLVPGRALLARAALAEKAGDVDVTGLKELARRQEGGSPAAQQITLFQEMTAVLCAVAQEQPLMLILDDIQWADAASIGLLFHLGRRLPNTTGRILIVCAYRAEEVAFGRDGARHPLAPALSEFKRTLGDVWLGLGPAEAGQGRRFVDALLDSEPNRLPPDFRSAMLQRTQGHPLFTVELLRAMQERGDLRRDGQGRWIPGPALNWDVLPTRTEAVIAERINRLDPDWQETLSIASVEGEVFTAQVVAQVQQVGARPLLRTLSAELEARHRLVREHGEVRTQGARLTRYRFSHVLFQEYLYERLGSGERRLLHAEVAEALEKLYVHELDALAVQLGHHYYEAADYRRALPHFTKAAERAARVHANEEAIGHYGRAIALAGEASLDAARLAGLYRGRGLVSATLGDFEGARADFEPALALARSAHAPEVQWRLLLDLGKLWASRDYQRARDYFEQALELARQVDDPDGLGSSLNWMGNWYANAENPARAAQYHREALAIFETIGDRPGLAKTLDLLGITSLLGADLNASVGYYDRAVALFREMDDRPRLLSSLMGRGTTVSLLVLLASKPTLAATDARQDIDEAIRLAREIHAPTEEAWAQWTLGFLHLLRGRFGLALEVMHKGVAIASKLGHGEWLVGNHFALGILYVELLAAEEARQHLEQALEHARALRSQYWINHVSGGLAAAYLLQDRRAEASACLQDVLTPGTAMDTMGKRYCWTRRAELALAEGDSSRVVDIVDRLVASAPGMPPDGVITYLWQLKAEAMAAMGRAGEAQSLLHAALGNAQAHGERFLLWRLHASLGRLQQALNRQEEARRAFWTAQALIGETAGPIADEALKDTFLQGAGDQLSLA